MSIRRQPGQMVLVLPATLNDGTPVEDSATGMGLIRSGDEAEPCTLHIVDRCDDPACQEWPNVDMLDEAGHPTGETAYHIPECRMSDAALHGDI